VNGGALDGWVLVCLAVMAVSLLAMAGGQIVLAVMAARTARQTIDTLQEFRRDIRPIVEKAQKIADDASRATAIAREQAERINQITERTAQKIDETLSTVQDAVGGPLRQGAAVIAGLRAALEVFRAVSDRRAAKDEDDALFIG
jgi:biopolymer transport protein ExbB/TolQ